MEAASVPAATTTERTATKRKPPKAPGTPWWLWLAVAAIVIFCLFPFYWLLNISLKTGTDLSSADIFPPNPTLDNYVGDTGVWGDEQFKAALVNSLGIALISTVLAVILATSVGADATIVIWPASEPAPEGFSVLEASNGIQALDQVDRGAFGELVDRPRPDGDDCGHPGEPGRHRVRAEAAGRRLRGLPQAGRGRMGR